MSNRDPHAACVCLSLAENEVGAAALCPQCGVVTLRLQYISLRFEADAFERVASLVQDAQSRLRSARGYGTAYREPDLAELRDDPSQQRH